MLEQEKTQATAHPRRSDAPAEGAIPKRIICPKARCAKYGRCERLGCNHVAGADVRVCNCCMTELGVQARDRIVSMRKAKHPDVIALEDEHLAKLNAMPRRSPSWKTYPTKKVPA